MISIAGVSRVGSPTDKVPTYAILHPNALTQVVGYFRFKHGDGVTMLRGQARKHSDLLPSALRAEAGTTLQEAGRVRRGTQLRDYIDTLCGSRCTCGPSGHSASVTRCTESVNSLRSPIVNSTKRAAVEPLLQHYGLNTRWLDVVDNVWVALWFACHAQMSTGRHAYHLRRSPSGNGDKAYVVVLRSGPLKAMRIPGYWAGLESRVLDLRLAAPSIYLRPHAQHGVLMAPPSFSPQQTGSLLPLVAAYLEIDLNDALNWLGDGAMLSPHVLFPPAARDEGYRRLLDYAPPPPPVLGHVTLYGPGY